MSAVALFLFNYAVPFLPLAMVLGITLLYVWGFR